MIQNLNPDKGSGRPGSLLWHTLNINQLSTVKEVQRYLYDVTGKTITLSIFKTLAVNLIKEYLDGKGK